VHDAAATHDARSDRVSVLERELEELRRAHLKLRHAYNRALEELQLIRRRLFVAKAERVDTNADQLAFEHMFERVEGLRNALGAIDAANGGAPDDDENRRKKKRKPTGRRDLAKTPLPVERVELVDCPRSGCLMASQSASAMAIT